MADASEPMREPELPGIEATLAERGARYGKFTEHAALAQAFKDVVADKPGYRRMKPDARQAMDVIFDKFARMLNGDPEYDDNWRDIVGYATLVLDRITADANQPALPILGLGGSFLHGDHAYGQVARGPTEDDRRP